MVRKAMIILAALMGLHAVAAAQELTVSGTVTDETGYPLEGATVMVRGTSSGTSTGADGGYELKVASDAEII